MFSVVRKIQILHCFPHNTAGQQREKWDPSTIDTWVMLQSPTHCILSHTQTHQHKQIFLFCSQAQTDSHMDTGRTSTNFGAPLFSSPPIFIVYTSLSISPSVTSPLLVLTAVRTLKMRTHSKHFSLYYPTQALTIGVKPQTRPHLWWQTWTH